MLEERRRKRQEILAKYNSNSAVSPPVTPAQPSPPATPARPASPPNVSPHPTVSPRSMASPGREDEDEQTGMPRSSYILSLILK